MKNIFLGIGFALSITGCAANQGSNAPLYKAFSNYDKAANKDNIVDVAHQFFSPSLLGQNYQSNPDAVWQLLFKDYMKRIESYHESAALQEGCLSINGYDKESGPVVFKLKYVSSSDQWLIDKIHVAFVESTADFASAAECPE